ncbi:MAG: metallophosphoesterase [Sphingopyxis sp.]
MGSITIFHASDLHFGAEDQSALDWFAGQVAMACPDAVFITGDITMRARHSEFAAAAEWLHALGRPLRIEIGNHDMPYFNPIERFTNPYRRYHSMAALAARSNSMAGAELPGIAMASLLTTAPAQWRLNWSKGVVRRKALASTVANLSNQPSAPIVLVTAHHPLVETGTHGTALTKGGSHALETLTKAGVTAILSGHVHDPFDLVHDNDHGTIRMIGAGTLSERLRSTPPSFNKLTINHGQLTVQPQFMR